MFIEYVFFFSVYVFVQLYRELIQLYEVFKQLSDLSGSFAYEWFILSSLSFYPHFLLWLNIFPCSWSWWFPLRPPRGFMSYFGTSVRSIQSESAANYFLNNLISEICDTSQPLRRFLIRFMSESGPKLFTRWFRTFFDLSFSWKISDALLLVIVFVTIKMHFFYTISWVSLFYE